MTKTSIDSSLDNILVQLGDFGRYQIFVFGLVCIAVVLHSAVHVAYVFTAMDLDYRCEIPGCDSATPEYEPSWLINAVPYSGSTPKSATCMTKSTILPKATIKPAKLKFSLREVDRGVHLLCTKALKRVFCKRFGRRVVLVWGMVLCAICGLIRTAMPTYEWFMVFEFLDAAFGSGTYICGFVLGVELVGPKKRVLTGVLASSCYAVGEVFTAGSAWIVKSWRPLIYILYTPSFLLLAYLWILPESIRWNLSKGRIEEAKKTLRTVAKVNGKELSDNALEKLAAADFDSQENSPFRDALKSTKLMLRMVNCCFCWITCTFLFYGLTLNSVSLAAGNSYLDFILTALVEIPAYVSCNLMLEVFGRKKSLCSSYLLTGVACICFIFVPSDSHAGSLSIYLIGKFGATAAFTNLYVVTSEVFPTTMRHSFMGTCSTFGRLGSMIAPQTPLLAKLWSPLPLVSFAVMSVIAGLLSLLFPETLNIKLPDTIEEAENISKLPKASSEGEIEKDHIKY
ncbi:hypothetical protein NQ318_000556 [Aromia moschata]|uniref:Organic cation transporter protein n=1 Tax=Aromia moschata TaxID=1265417 RepID=A0AAV8XWV6_9CUCU|nr:hypothetical protein NQ318_000556 [Aromia moschata]